MSNNCCVCGIEDDKGYHYCKECLESGKASDRYHMFEELYDHRCLLFLNLLSRHQQETRWTRDHFPGWDHVILVLPNVGQISYHIKKKYRYILEGLQIKENTNTGWDGHTADDVLTGLEKSLQIDIELEK